MDNYRIKSAVLKQKRQLRVRKKLRGTADKPRLCVIKTNQHIHIQLIDDVEGCTLAAISTHSKQMQETPHRRKSKEAGKVLGQKIAQIALGKQVKQAVFDRGPHRYHGVIAAVADGAREAGLEF